MTPSRSGQVIADKALGALIRRLPGWCKRPEFVAVLLAGALLRLFWLDSTSFLGDQAQLLAVARAALDAHSLPLTGIMSSIGTLNPPASIYLLLPFAALPDPFWAALFTAVANVAAVILLFRIADRYVGRVAAFAAGLLYATAAGPVWYSRFTWQQNLLAPVLLLFFWFLCRGVVDRRRGWLAWNLACWAIAVQLHPTAAPLLALTALGVLFTWRESRLRDAAVAAGAAALLLAPYALWLAVTGGADVSRLLGSAGGKAVLDATAPTQLLLLALPAPANALGASSPYQAAYPLLGVLAVAVALLVLGSTMWLVEVVVRPVLPLIPPLLRCLRRISASSSHQEGGHDRHDLALASPRWRFCALLLLWEVMPLLVMLRHGQQVYPHYLLASLPAVFLVMGIFLARIPAATVEFAGSRGEPSSIMSRLGWLQLHSQQVIVALVLLLALGQAYGSVTQIVAIHQGTFEAGVSGSHYGWPLDDQRSALVAARDVARPLGASVVVASDALHEQPLGYLAATSYGPASVYDASACLVTPAAGSPPQVTLSPVADSARELLTRMSGVTTLKTLPVAAGLAPALYRVPSGATLPGETAVSTSSPGSAPQLAGYLFDHNPASTPRLVMRWEGAPTITVQPSQALRYYFGATPKLGATPLGHYRFYAQPLDSQGHTLEAPEVADCPQLAWAQGMNVTAWVGYPSALAGRVASWRVWADVAPFVVTRPTLGQLRFETGAVREGKRIAVGGQGMISAA
ncbi:MAG TPA: glycosyltransferase family 39 protein [Ktedonobacterales bacterium]